MTDPLRPFAQIIRALWRGGARAATTPATTTGGELQSSPAATRDTLETRLATRIGSLDPQNPAKLRQTFVETILLWEFGERLAADPTYTEMIERICAQLESDPVTTHQLNGLLAQLAEPPRR